MPPLHITSPPPASPSSSPSVSPSYRRSWSSAALENSSAQGRPVEGALPRPSAAHGGVQSYNLRERLLHREISAPPLVDTGSASPSGTKTSSHIRFPSVDEFGLPIRRQSSSAHRYSLQQEEEPCHEESSFIPLSDEKSRIVAEDKRLDAKAISSSAFQSRPSTSHDDAPAAQSIGPGAASSKTSKPKVSEWSYQRMNASEGEDEDEEEEEDDDGGWKDMPALGELDYYDDTGHLVAKAGGAEEADDAVYQGLGGAGKGYTRVQLDDDARSVTSLDDDTGYLFREPQSNALGIDDDDPRDLLSQMQTTKELLTEGQRIAYVGLTRLMIFQMIKEVKDVEPSRAIKKFFVEAVDGLSKWGQKIMMRLYIHMDISAEEQLMIEQLSQHGVIPEDLVPTLMQNASVKNPMSSRSNRTSVSSAVSPVSSHDRQTRPRSMGMGSIDSVSASNIKSPSLKG
ncbi:hypothetical protein KEM54_003625, partial [Ascosphaera aggregata]